jgi:hypothetical protein
MKYLYISLLSSSLSSYLFHPISLPYIYIYIYIYEFCIRRNLLTQDFDLRRHINETPLMLNLPMSYSGRSNQEMLCQLVFESLEMPALYMSMQPLMSLYACGVVNGLVVDVGHDLTSIPLSPPPPIVHQLFLTL